MKNNSGIVIGSIGATLTIIGIVIFIIYKSLFLSIIGMVVMAAGDFINRRIKNRKR
ncbi:MAG: hypothetical protein SVU94_05225 [Bacteroidota bacterium]|nr:hypothetical protein [Bacteroidota bacterium]